MSEEPANPVHMISGPQTRWTTVNFGEAMGGVQTPLSWAVWNYGMEISSRRAFGAMGVLRPEEVPVPPDDVNGRMSAIFFGRVAGNVGFFRTMGDRMPGSSGDVLEHKLFGEVTAPPAWGPPGGVLDILQFARKFPVAAFKAPRSLPATLADQRAWWRRNTRDAPPDTLAGAQRLVREGAERFAVVAEAHATVSMLGPQLLETLADLAGDPGLGADLATGFGGMEETQIISDVWATAHERMTLDQFVAQHGFHGPDEGQLHSRSWREDRAPVEAMLRSYLSRDIADPRERERAQIDRRLDATRRVRAALPAVKRPVLDLVLKLAAILIPARELGKAAFLHNLDGSRCGARIYGRILTDQGLLSDPEDAFFLTLEELTAPPSPELAELVAGRRANHERYLGLELPQSWNGVPVPLVREAETAQATNRITGIGVVGSKVTGRARVVHDPTTTELDDGDILVCAMTDPSWTPLFMLADALVIDTGGQISHGAIVARELGVCCVINTVTGTRDIPDGATITVDGATGVVEIH